MGLTAKFNMVLVGVFVLGLLVAGLASWGILRENARHEVVDRAGLMMNAALAMRGYTISQIKPLLADKMRTEFLPQSVPAYAATETFEKLREEHPEYAYKEATLNPTNPRNRAVDWETDLVQAFRNHPEEKQIMGMRETPTGTVLYLARPIRVKNQGCLNCHSTVQAAPKTMRVRYGEANGFGWKLKEVVGAQIVSVPMGVPIRQAQRAFLVFMGTLAAIFVAITLALNVMLRRIVIRPVTQMAATADAVSHGNLSAPELTPRGTDEIAVLASSFNRMRRSMEKAIKMLQE